ncbi:hypothetical protein AWC38_SpisGene3850 [Stylophora pistillata]|uniref:Integrase catalytic domain-containing protein n=1 Tax=Stylophora pistillata TaxID=50429 RepID=A0A2B4SPK3_STYPI|nr:hypothetical protein AWC38_SpisGene3850 [Stylophora pistillata]
MIRMHYGFQSTGAHFIDLNNIKLEPNERPEDLFQRLMSFEEDNLLVANGPNTHHGEAVTSDEELSPSLENLVILTWLRLVHSDLPTLVKQRYGTELRSRTLASLIVVEDLDVDILAGIPFLVANDITIRPATQEVTIHGVSSNYSPSLGAFYMQHPVRLTLDTGAETSMIKASLARKLNLNIVKSNQKALLADGTNPLNVIGEVAITRSRTKMKLTLEALVVEDLDVNILADLPDYNGSAGSIEAHVNMGPVEPPQRKGRLPLYPRDKLIELQEKFDDLEKDHVFSKPEEADVHVQYLNPPFLVKKPSGGHRLVTAFADVDMGPAWTRVSSSCHTCASLQKFPSALFSQTSEDPPDVIGIAFAADVIKRERQLILIPRECATSYIAACLIADEKYDTSRSALTCLVADLHPIDGPRADILVDPAPAFVSLSNNDGLKHLNVWLDIGRIKNKNKNPVAERAVQELEDELLKQVPGGGPIDQVSLAIAVARLNTRLRRQGLSSRELWTQRSQFTGNQLPVADYNTILAIVRPEKAARLKPLPRYREKRPMVFCQKVLRLSVESFFLEDQVFRMLCRPHTSQLPSSRMNRANDEVHGEQASVLDPPQPPLDITHPFDANPETLDSSITLPQGDGGETLSDPQQPEVPRAPVEPHVSYSNPDESCPQPAHPRPQRSRTPPSYLKDYVMY